MTIKFSIKDGKIFARPQKGLFLLFKILNLGIEYRRGLYLININEICDQIVCPLWNIIEVYERTTLGTCKVHHYLKYKESGRETERSIH